MEGGVLLTMPADPQTASFEQGTAGSALIANTVLSPGGQAPGGRTSSGQPDEVGFPTQRARLFALTGLPSSGVPGACATRTKVGGTAQRTAETAREIDVMNESELNIMIAKYVSGTMFSKDGQRAKLDVVMKMEMEM